MTMLNLNEVTICGHLGDTPEVKHTQSNSPYCRLSIATNEQWKDKNSGENQKKTSWHRCIAWGSQAENLAKFFKKGDAIYVRGTLEYGNYKNRDDVTIYTTDIRVQYWKFVDAKENGKGGNRPPQQEQEPQEPPTMPQDDDDIPF